MFRNEARGNPRMFFNRTFSHRVTAFLNKTKLLRELISHDKATTHPTMSYNWTSSNNVTLFPKTTGLILKSMSRNNAILIHSKRTPLNNRTSRGEMPPLRKRMSHSMAILLPSKPTLNKWTSARKATLLLNKPLLLQKY